MEYRMTYDQYDSLDKKLDRVLEKLDLMGQRVSTVERTQKIYCGIVNWSGGTFVLVCLGLIGFLLKTTLFV